MCEDFPVDFIDTIWFEAMKNLHRAVYVDSIKIFHNHAYACGEDDTFKRMQLVRSDAWGQPRSKIAQIAAKMSENIKKNLADEFESEIKVIMTTHDRLKLLRRTVDSYLTCGERPKEFYVCDDCSEEVDEVERVVKEIPEAKFVRSEVYCGCNAKTPEVLWKIFKDGAKAIIIIDSDSLFSEHWWAKANYIYRQLKNDPDFGCVSLFNNQTHKPTKCKKYSNLGEKLAVGAFACIITKSFYETYTIPAVGTYHGWDNDMCRRARLEGKKIYCTIPTFIQHIGTFEGMHANTGVELPAWADDFIGEQSNGDTKEFTPVLGGGPRTSILIICMGRYGDIIAASMIVNILIRKGYSIDWLTIKKYRELVSAVCPKASVLIYGDASPDAAWAQISEAEVAARYPYYGGYINLQIGSPEHHDNYIASHMHPMDYLHRHACSTLGGILLWKEYAQYLVYQHEKKISIERDGRPLCVIVPEAITSNAISEALLAELIEKYSQQYDVKILCDERPGGISYRRARSRYIYGHKFHEAISAIMQADLFIGNDSGMAWASLYNKDCKKIIYHTAERIQKVNTRFSHLDKNAEDIIV
jgi:hypothetical protein